MMISIKEHKLILISLYLLFILGCFQNLTVINFGGFGLKAVHLFSLLFLPLLWKKHVLKLPDKIVSLFICFILVHALVMLPIFGVSSLVLNYLYGFYLLLIVVNIGCDFSKEDWLVLFRHSALLIIFFVWVKNLLQISIILEFLKAPLHHPMVSTLFGGGVNIEASFLSLFCFFFNFSGIGIVYFVLCVITSAIYMSRAAILILVIYFLYNILFVAKSKKFGVYIIILSVILMPLLFGEQVEYLISRFANIGNEPGSIGRLNMYIEVPSVLFSYPLGVGMGNCLDVIRNLSGIPFYENNLHNLYLQMFVDLGILGGCLYLFICTYFVYKNFTKLKSNFMLAFLYAYLIISLIQFRGGDALVFFVLGAYIASDNNKIGEYK